MYTSLCQEKEMGYVPANLGQNPQEEVPHAAGSHREHR